MSMSNWQALHSLTRDGSVKGQELAPGTTRRVLSYAVPYRGRIAFFLLWVVIDSVLVVATPLLLKSLVDDGILTKEEAERVAGRHIILQALGSEERLAVERGVEPLKDGDILLLCTDGLSGLVRHEALEAAMRKGSPSLDGLCAKLVEMAEAEGGTDNITVLLARINRGW